MTTCAILANSYFERQRKYGTALVKTTARVIAFAINNHPRWYPLRSATMNSINMIMTRPILWTVCYATIAARRAAANDKDTARAKMAQGVDLWQAAAAAGSGAAMNFLGAYYNGTFNSAKLSFVQPDSQKAFDYWLKGARANNTKAMENAGIVYLAGPSDYPPIQRDVDKAQLWLTKAIQGGSTNAAVVLGEALFYGSTPGLTRDVKKGLDYLTKACIAGEVGAKRFFDHEMNRPQYRTLLPAVRPTGCDSEIAPVANSTQSILQSPAKSSSTYWDYNESILELIADGPSRKFYYYSPRPSLDPVGVKRGTLAFDGKRTGNKYSGNAYVFSRYCGSLAFPVTGTVSDEERKVQFSGMVPRRNSSCAVVESTNQTFEFSLRANGVN
jgi:Sel1 repeat